MLETVDLSAHVDPDAFAAQKEQLRQELNRVQNAAWQDRLGVVVVLEGWNFSGKAHCMRFLTEPLDPRGLKVHVMYPPTREDRRYPFQHRYAVRMPAYGQLALFVRSWYYHVLDERVLLGRDALTAQVALDEITQGEKAFADDGCLIVKFWLHIDKKEQKKRRKELDEGALRRYRIGPDDPRQHKHWKKYTQAIEEMLAATDTEYARWHLVPATDHRFAQQTVAATLIRRIDEELALRKQRRAVLSAEPPAAASPAGGNGAAPASPTLASLDMNRNVADADYSARILAAQRALNELQYRCVDERRAVLFCFEGWDASGKGGVIRRLTAELDPRYYEVHPVAAPRGEEADHHYLWRFWRAIPPAGQWAVFDRTWYGRVLVERVEGFARYDEWQRAYREICHFEAALHEHGAIVLKFWLHVTPDEQLRRFREREEVTYKRYKITKEDWRNREKWPQYEQAVEEMVRRSSTAYAPWHLIPANDKAYARLTVLETCIEQIRKGLGQKRSQLRRNFRVSKR
jgi:polyphosphate:AMP phosphotransferase